MTFLPRFAYLRRAKQKYGTPGIDENKEETDDQDDDSEDDDQDDADDRNGTEETADANLKVPHNVKKQ